MDKTKHLDPKYSKIVKPLVKLLVANKSSLSLDQLEVK